jgi:hypothetical protein
LGVPIQAQWHHGFRGPLRGHPISHSRCLGRKGNEGCETEAFPASFLDDQRVSNKL